MQVEKGEYTIESFLDYISENRRLLKVDGKKKWLKIYSFVTDADWRNLGVFNVLSRYGELYRVRMRTGEKIAYLIEPKKGWILLFTTANDKEYLMPLENMIQKTPGIMEFWIKPFDFERFVYKFMEKSHSRIYKFSSRTPNRKWNEQKPHSGRWGKEIIREEFSRRISYTGEDADRALNELRDMYGVIPEKAYAITEKGVKLRMKNDGLFSIQSPSKDIIYLYYSMLEKESMSVLELIKKSRNIQTKIENFEISSKKYRYPISQAGLISISNDAMISMDDFEKFKKEIGKRYVHFNTSLNPEAEFSMSTDVFDEAKNILMKAEINMNTIILGYPYGGRFDTTLGYYKEVLDNIDPSASLELL